MDNWNNVKLVPEFSEQGVDCYRLEGGNYENEYYVVSESETRKLLNTPEVVGYEVYHCLIPSTSQMLYYFKEQKKVTTANILSILRGALNYPLEESCYREHIRVHDISFLSSERVFNEDEIAGLEIKYSKLTMVPDSTLLIGDIIATGETLIHCLRYVTDFYREHGARRYEIHEHVEEVLEFWKEMLQRADQIDFKELLDEKLGYVTPISYEDWVKANHYEKINPSVNKWLYKQEQGYIQSMQDVTLKEIAEERIQEFTTALKKYII